jgi:phage gp46-like protein
MTKVLYKDPGIVLRLETSRSLQTIYAVALLTRARARDDDDLIDPTDRGGSYVDTLPDKPGDQFGSRLWTLQGRGMDVALAEAPGMVREALQFAIDDGIVLDNLIEVGAVAGTSLLSIQVTPTLPTGEIVDPLEPWHISV